MNKPLLLLAAACTMAAFTACNRQSSRTPAAKADGLLSLRQDMGRVERDKRTARLDDSMADLSAMLPAPRRDLPEQRLTRKAYVASFNNRTLMPNWVAWKLTRQHTNGGQKRGHVRFEEDGEVAPQYRVSTFDYNRSGFDRGHLCPAGDNRWDRTAMEQCFLMTNICPQNHALNAGSWNDLEIRCRAWARRYGEIYIVCGPVLYGKGQRRIGQRRKVTVPDAFFKVVLCMVGTPKAIGYVYPNKESRRPMHDYALSVDEVERITGYDFFASLPDGVEQKVEANASAL